MPVQAARLGERLVAHAAAVSLNCVVLTHVYNHVRTAAVNEVAALYHAPMHPYPLIIPLQIGHHEGSD